MKLEIPSKLEYYSIDQANRVIEYMRTDPFETRSDERAIVGLVAAVTGLPEQQLMRVDMDPLKKAYRLITSQLHRKPKLPPREVTINGQVYEFQQDLNAKGWNAGRYVDIKVHGSILEQAPEYIVAICYIEKESNYMDHPLDARAKLMKEHFSGEHFIDLTAFFLRKYYNMNPGYSLLQIARSQVAREKAMQILQSHGSNGSTTSAEKTIPSGSRSQDGIGRNFFSRLLTRLGMTRKRQ